MNNEIESTEDEVIPYRSNNEMINYLHDLITENPFRSGAPLTVRKFLDKKMNKGFLNNYTFIENDEYILTNKGSVIVPSGQHEIKIVINPTMLFPSPRGLSASGDLVNNIEMAQRLSHNMSNYCFFDEENMTLSIDTSNESKASGIVDAWVRTIPQMNKWNIDDMKYTQSISFLIGYINNFLEWGTVTDMMVVIPKIVHDEVNIITPLGQLIFDGSPEIASMADIPYELRFVGGESELLPGEKEYLLSHDGVDISYGDIIIYPYSWDDRDFTERTYPWKMISIIIRYVSRYRKPTTRMKSVIWGEPIAQSPLRTFVNDFLTVEGPDGEDMLLTLPKYKRMYASGYKRMEYLPENTRWFYPDEYE